MVEKGGKLHETIQDMPCVSPEIPHKREFLNAHIKREKDQRFEYTVVPQDILNNFDEHNPAHAAFAAKEWERRRNGVFFWNCGEITYITGLHYYYLNYFALNTGKPEYRDSDRKFFWVWEFCVQHRKCFGLLYITKRREGKSSKAGVIGLEYVTSHYGTHCGMQSRDDNDAKNLFKRSVVYPWRKLVSFFSPEFRTSTNPSRVIEFFARTDTGKSGRTKGGAVNTKSELGSWIDYEDSKDGAYDSHELARFINDEIFKKQPGDPEARWSVVKKAQEKKGVIIGKSLHTSSVGEEENEEETEVDRARKMWNESDYRDSLTSPNGKTKSGLFRLFLPAYEGHLTDDYGRSMIPESKADLQAELDAARGDVKATMKLKRSKPWNIDDALLPSGKNCEYDAAIIGYALEQINALPVKPYVRGDLLWADEKKTKVRFVHNEVNGRFLFSWMPGEDDRNRMESIGEMNTIYGQVTVWRPLLTEKHVLATDPFGKSKITNKKTGSNAAAHAFRKYDLNVENNSHHKDYHPTHAFFAEYLYRPNHTHTYYEDMILACHFLGCMLLFENQKDMIEEYFINRGYGYCLMSRPEFTHTAYTRNQEAAGLPSSEKTIGQYVELTRNFIATELAKDFRKCPFPRTLSDWLVFNSSKTKEFDAAVSSGFTLIADRNTIHRRVATVNVEDFEEIFNY